MAKQYQNHTEVPSQEKWDLTFLLEGQTPEARIDELLKIYDEYVAVKDSKYLSPTAYLAAIKIYQRFQLKLNKISNFISNSINLDLTSPVPAQLAQKLEYGIYQANQRLGAEDARFFAHAKEIAQWATTPSFADYRYSLERRLAAKTHQLPKAIEEFRNVQSRADGDFHSVFALLTDAEMDRGFGVDAKGRKHRVTLANIAQLSRSDDKALRTSAQKAVKDAYWRHRQSLANLLFQHKKSEATYTPLLKFPSTVEALIFGDRVPKTLLTTLFAEVQKNVAPLRLYRQAWKQFYKARFGEAPTRYDLKRELIKPAVKDITVAEGIKEMLVALQPMGEEYVAAVRQGLDDRWVDFHAVKNKLSGAYSIGSTHGIERKLILMNWDGTDRAVETLIHEFGHSMHSYYSEANNSVANSQYRIFVAEVASIFNELLLLDHRLKNATNDRERFVALDQAITGFDGTVFRQTEWANYEYDFYTALDAGEAVNTFEAQSRLYHTNALRYTAEKKLRYEPHHLDRAVSVPHFYYGFYVYKYAIGQLVANIFFAKYKAEGPQAIRQYIDAFLAAGGRQDPLVILRAAGVDLLDPQVYELGFRIFADNVKAWVKVGNRLFSSKSKKKG